MEEPGKGETVNPCMYLQGKIQSYGSFDKLKLIIVVRGDLQNNTWYPTSSMITLKYLLAYTSKHKARVHQFGLIGAFLQENVKHIVFVNLDSRYGEYFPEYCNYFVRPLRLDN